MKWASGFNSHMETAWKLPNLLLQQERAEQTENQQLYLGPTKNLVFRAKSHLKTWRDR